MLCCPHCGRWVACVDNKRVMQNILIYISTYSATLVLTNTVVTG